jgi:hypothetical protein
MTSAASVLGVNTMCPELYALPQHTGGKLRG